MDFLYFFILFGLLVLLPGLLLWRYGDDLERYVEEWRQRHAASAAKRLSQREALTRDEGAQGAVRRGGSDRGHFGGGDGVGGG